VGIVKDGGRVVALAGQPTRDQRKRRTRQALLDAALEIMSEGRSFTSLGLREITRRSGVVPTSFYRHFRDLDELGLSLVDESGMTLRRLLREARRGGMPNSDMIRRSVSVYTKYVEEHRRQFLFIASERGGGSAAIRNAIRNEVRHFVHEMAQDLRELNVLPALSTETLQMICGLVVNTMLNAATDILDLPPGDTRLERDVIENFVRQLRVIFLGAGAWREPDAR
jgi:AcrR family transcriptional regulator